MTDLINTIENNEIRLLAAMNLRFRLAARDGDISKIKELLKKGTGILDVNATDEYGWTALMIACWNRHGKVVELLIKHGADVNMQNRDGDTPLMRLCWNPTVDVSTIKLLLDNGANVNAKNSTRKTVSTFARIWGHKEAIELLKKYGAK